ncbi:MAG: DUF5367 family protein, partial [Nanoarchaeales archaeon]|nr:DUF5367 family protein [Nanoarchaeales archaeon]
MKNLNLKRVAIAGFITYAIGVAAFLTSFFVPVMSNPELQANFVLAFAIIPASIIGASFYLKKDFQTKGLLVGIGMFIITMLLDAIITVPVFVIPHGGDFVSFFTDPGFWLIALL